MQAVVHVKERKEGHRDGRKPQTIWTVCAAQRVPPGWGQRPWVEAQGWYLGERRSQCLFNQASPPTTIRQLPTASPPLPLYSGYRRLCKPAGQVRQAVLARRGGNEVERVLINHTWIQQRVAAVCVGTSSLFTLTYDLPAAMFQADAHTRSTEWLTLVFNIFPQSI